VTVLAVGLAGLAGVLARYGLGTLVSTANTPWMTLAINVAGSFVLGALIPLGDNLSAPLRAGIAIGFCGGFTTFSTVSVEVFYDAHAGDAGFAVLYLAASIAGGLLGAAIGYYAGRALAH
jgi:fluoride exporter